ncbi:MAG: DUF2249 domain-containing protein [Mariprofundaceae bacterium]|nr:DUF2249 domain-containing protein [Mariprofundaceae bacterium]
MKPEQFLDVNLLEPPEPMEHILSAIDALTQGHYLRIWIHREPFPLYDILGREGFSHAIRPGQHSLFELFIWHGHDKTVRGLVQSVMQSDEEDSLHCRE